MSIQVSAPVKRQPRLTLERWRIFLVENNWHVVAWCVESQDGRVTSPLASFDAARRLATTTTGRIYELAGPPGDDGDADYTWHWWRRRLGAPAVRDITQHVLQTANRDGPSAGRFSLR